MELGVPRGKGQGRECGPSQLDRVWGCGQQAELWTLWLEPVHGKIWPELSPHRACVAIYSVMGPASSFTVAFSNLKRARECVFTHGGPCRAQHSAAGLGEEG